MNEQLENRIKACAIYYVDNKSTIRKTAKVFGIGKSTLSYDFLYKLPYIDKRLYQKVRKLVASNFKDKHIRGGMATKHKYLILKNSK